jgi:transcriptional regulator NrdR family protein
VADSRARDGGGIKRRRVCLKCGHRFNTVELCGEQLAAMQAAHAIPVDVLKRLASLHESMQVCIKRLLNAADIKI